MKLTSLFTVVTVALVILLFQGSTIYAESMGTAFTYQGSLIDSNDVADGLYDFQFKLYDSAADGNQLNGDVNVPDSNVIDGYFTVELDFGSSVFDGNAVWLEIGIRPGYQNDPCTYTTLIPRQKVTPTPYSLQTRGIFVDDAGNVGIGTNSPRGSFEVWGPPETEMLDQQQTIASGSYGSSITDSWQSFTPGIAGYLTKLELFISMSAGPSATLQIYDGEGKTGGLLTTQSITSSQSGYYWHTFKLTYPPLLHSGKKYTYRITADFMISFTDSSQDPYPGGRSSYSSSYDLSFKTYMIPPSPTLITDSVGGKVGIGTASPVATLDVNGPAKILAWQDQSVSPNGYAWVGSILFQWGSRVSTLDGPEEFTFTIPFPNECFTVNYALPGVVTFTKNSFFLDRHNDYGGAQNFTFLAIGH